MNDRGLTPSNEMVFTFVTIVVVCMVNCGLSVLAADEEPVAAESPSKGPSPETTAQPTPSSVSPDKKWEYRPDESAPKIVKAGTDEVALDLSDQPAGNGFSFATVIWAPDSKRFAFNYGQGREHATSLYQLRSDEWKPLKSPGDVGDVLQRAENAAQLTDLAKKKLSKKNMYLRLIWWTEEVDQWVDSNTAILHASLREATARRDEPGEMFDDFNADLLLTLKFDAQGKWKIVKTHRMSEKEVKEHQ